jgi:hypothetical protein
MITVLDGPTADNATVASSGNINIAKMKVNAGEQFRFIKLKTSLEKMHQKDFLGSTLFYILLFLPLGIIPIIVLLKKKKEAIDGDVAGNKRKLSNKLAKRYLSEAKNQIANKEPFYIALEKVMHNFLKAKLNIETSEMSKDKIQEILLSRNVQTETVQSFITLTENCEFARYAPASSVVIQQDYDKAVTIISDLEKQIS